MTNAPRTLTELFFGAMDRFASRPVALRAKRGGAWQDISHAELLRQVHGFSAGLLELGVRPGDRVAILSENRPEWAVTDFACLAARCADVPVYPTLPAHQIAYILRDSGAVAVCCSTADQLAKILEVRGTVPSLKHLIVFDPDAARDGAVTFAAVLARGEAAKGNHPTWRADALAAGPDDLATLIYTSGTTGDPKGVMLTHGNITSDVIAGLQVLDLRGTDECLSFLPLSHIFERMAGHYCMTQMGAVINYATTIENVPAEMGELRPTVVCSVPRLYEKIYARVLENAMAGSPLKQKIFRWAKRIGEAWAELHIEGKPIPTGLALKYAVAHRLVFSKLVARVGGRLRFFVSGGAPLSADIARFFYAAGLPIMEGYGLTETSPVITVNGFGRARFGTVGKVVPGVEVKIAADGEILTRGPNVMKGYFNKPEATAEVLSADGWFSTGDIGELDADGFLRITDRKKDIIVTAGGKNIAPQPVENLVKRNPLVLNAVMIGDKRQYPIMLVVPNMEALRKWTEVEGMADWTDGAILGNAAVQTKLTAEIRKTLRDLAHYETPKKFLLLDKDFSIESGELTPTLKVKRRVVEQRHQERIEALYKAGGAETIY
ncbi:MAG TPA: long-chain fatty acid--CoA ligase [Gemmatimonadales bacterium]|nr:long-chain fatty acid--CoA ligase [Gemmatimonadales bacterium]